MPDKPLILDQAIANSLDIIGDRWTLLILQGAFSGHRRFEQFREATGASRATLTRRLKALVDHDIFYKRPYSPSARRFEYRLSEKGLALFGASLLAQQWELDWNPQHNPVLDIQRFHTRCKNTLHPEIACRHCQQKLQLEDIKWLDHDSELGTQVDVLKTIHGHRRVRTSTPVINPDTPVQLTNLVGDRWTLLILILAFFGTNRYDDFLRPLQIASAVLVERLKTLVEAEVFKRQRYQENPPRYAYKLTAKGKSLYPFTMALRQWAIDWMTEKPAAANLIHETCGATLAIDIHCSACGQIPSPKEVAQNRDRA